MTCSSSFCIFLRTKSRRLGNDQNELHRISEYIGQYIFIVAEPTV